MNKLKYIFSLSLFFSLLVGCSSNPQITSEKSISDSRLFQLYIDDDGNLLDPFSKAVIKNEKKYVTNILKNFEYEKSKNKSLELMVFIHGGLNDFESSTTRVEEKKDLMLADKKYPLFISWDSSGGSNYADHLFQLRRGVKAEYLGPLSSPFVFIEDMLRSASRIPASTYNILIGQNSVPIFLENEEEESARMNMQRIRSQGFTLHDNPNDTGHTFWDWWSILNPIKLVSAPFVDGLGTGAWNSMLRRTDLVLMKDPGKENGGFVDTAVTQFFDRFSETFGATKKDNIESKGMPVTIIGHSMGSIVSNNIIAKYSNINFNNIVYLAAACRIKDLEYVIAPYLHKNKQSSFYNLTLNPYRDISENFAFDFAPRGSLLIWIDTILGDVNSFQDRTAGFWFNIVRAAEETFPSEVRSRVHLTQFGVADGSPETHGSFGDYPFWKNSFWKGEHEQKPNSESFFSWFF